ncbi:MAG TPA: hypothetical protein VJ695_00950 [Nitrososphaera sp.]|nr:hypothetical protein [Nitrososphaera sp.]
MSKAFQIVKKWFARITRNERSQKYNQGKQETMVSSLLSSSSVAGII